MRNEATIGLERGVLVSAELEPCRRPVQSTTPNTEPLHDGPLTAENADRMGIVRRIGVLTRRNDLVAQADKALPAAARASANAKRPKKKSSVPLAIGLAVAAVVIGVDALACLRPASNQPKAEISGAQRPMPALQVAAADPCAGARADWEALAASNDVALLSAYRDGLAASCSIQLGLVTAQLEMLAKADAARAQAAQGAKALVGAFAGAWAAVPGEGGECGLLPWRFEKTEAGYDRVSSGDGREPFKRIASAPPILQHSGGLKIIVRGDQMDVLPPGQRAMCKLQRQRELRMTAPILTTARLTLRAHRESDFEDLCAMWADPDVTRFIGGKPSSREESWSRLLRYGGQWSIVGYGFWAVTRTGEDKLIGDVGVMKTQRAMEPALVAPETGWCLAPEAHGQGLALEAMQAALAWADVQIGPATQCIIDRANAASIRVAEKLGYRRTHQAQYHGAAIDVWGRGV